MNHPQAKSRKNFKSLKVAVVTAATAILSATHAFAAPLVLNGANPRTDITSVDVLVGFDIQTDGILVATGTGTIVDFAGGTWTGLIRPTLGASVRNTGTLSVNAANLGNVFAQSSPAPAAGGSFINSATGTLSFNSSATVFAINSSTSFVNDGTINLSPTTGLTFRSSTNASINTGFFVNNGTINHSSSGLVKFQNAGSELLPSNVVEFSQSSGATLNITGGGAFIVDRPISGSRPLNGTVNVSSGVFAIGEGADATPISGKGVFSVTDSTKPTLANVTINADVLRSNPLVVTVVTVGTGARVASTSTLTLEGGDVELQGGTLTATTIEVATTELVGNGTVNGNVILSNKMNPHGTTLNVVGPANVGTIVVNGDLTVNGGTLFFDLNALNGTADKITINGTLTLGSSDVLGFGINQTASLAEGQSYDLLDFNSPISFGGNLDNLLSNLPEFDDSNLLWNTSAFLTTGTISVIAVPEPGVLITTGILALTIALRRVRL